MERKASDGKKMNRGKFLGFLGKIGILSLIPGLPALGAPKTGGKDTKFLHPDLTETRCGELLRSPMIKGKTLSKAVLTAKLTSENLENIRDLMTGRFFGKVAQDVFKDGYKPFISWNLGTDGNDSGCLFYCDSDPETPSDIDNCGMYITWKEDTGEVVISVLGKPGVFGGPDSPSGVISSAGIQGRVELAMFGNPCSSKCETACPSDCSHCFSFGPDYEGRGANCDGVHCNPQRTLDLKEMISNKDDMFVNEILEILGTSDVRTVQAELKNVIFSDEVLNMGLEHFITNAYDAAMGDD